MQASPLEQQPLPFSLELPDGGSATTLVCSRVVRRLPGRRLVCAGTWQGRDVYAKLFLDPRKARRDRLREQRGIEWLAAAGIPTPALLYAGPAARQRCQVLVTAAVTHAETLERLWQHAAGQAGERERLLRAMARLFARHHAAGIVHADPHLNNFLVAADTVYTLDGADVGRRDPPLPAAAALHNLAVFFAIVRAEAAELAAAFFAEYAAAAGIPQAGSAWHEFQARVAKVQRRSIRKYLRNKIFRECTAFSRRRSLRRLVMLARGYDSPALRRLLDAPDAVLAGQSATVLKRGNTATVAAVTVDGRELVIKHYRVKGLLHWLRKTGVRSRAEHSWINAHRLLRYGINTAAPVALVLNTIGPLRLDACLVTERVRGPVATEFFASTAIDPATRRSVAGRLGELLRRLAANGLHHGDLKASNILIAGEEPVLLDLDSLRQYAPDSPKFRRAFRKDLERFARNWSGDGEFDRQLREIAAGIAGEFL